jgi:hypothetical protein
MDINFEVAIHDSGGYCVRLDTLNANVLCLLQFKITLARYIQPKVITLRLYQFTMYKDKALFKNIDFIYFNNYI